jgi:hypothetical protein
LKIGKWESRRTLSLRTQAEVLLKLMMALEKAPGEELCLEENLPMKELKSFQ